jgi:hypothetical protein
MLDRNQDEPFSGIENNGIAPPRSIIEAPESGRGTVMPPDNMDDIIARMSEPVQDGYYITKMNVDWTFDTWNSPSQNAYVENSPDNLRTVYFDLILDETGELIYSSPFIPLGAKLENFALDSPVPAGEYSAVVTYHLVDDEFENLSSVSVAVLLRILG